MNDLLSIGRLTLRWQGPPDSIQRPALRLASERWLARVDIRLPGLSGGAVLVVRRLAGLPPLSGHPSPEWEQTLHDRIVDLYRHAVRPVNGWVDPQAQCVVFDDPAQLLAMLTRDLWHGQAHQRWYWWHYLPAASPSAAAVAALWSTQAQWLPAALEALPLEDLKDILSRFTPREISQIVHALHTAFDLPSEVLHVNAPDRSAAPQADLPIDPPWTVYEAAAQQDMLLTLVPQAQYLAGLAVVLRRAPAEARRPAFAQEAARWLRAALSRPLPIENENGEQPLSPIIPPESEFIAAARPEVWDVPGDLLLPGVNKVPRGSENTRPLAIPVQETPTEVGTLPPAEGVWTQIGGVLFLINVLEWMGLFGHLPAGHSPWRVIAALARALMGNEFSRYAHDALWEVLVSLDQTAPSAAVMSVANFRLRPEWLRLDPQAERHWMAHADSNRLLVTDAAAGYVVLDEPLNGRLAADVLAAALEDYAAQGVEWLPYLPAIFPAGGVEEWTARLALFLQTGLVFWLGLEEKSDHAITAALLARPGRLLVSRTHIDFFSPPDRVSIAVRRAGLDRDPGWQPDLGYIVLFHFV